MPFAGVVKMVSEGVMFAANRVSMSYRTRYGSFRSVDDVSLEVRKGEAVAVIGPSGCGKSSLLLACARLVPLDSGSVTFRGKALLRPSKDYSVLFQNNSLFPWMTVSDNVELPLRIRHVPAPERVATVAHWLNVVGMSEARNLFTRELSGGMRQRTALARAMVSKPELLFMDEGLSAADAIVRSSLRAGLKASVAAGELGILFVTHDLDEAALLANRCILLDGPPAHVVDEISIADGDGSGRLLRALATFRPNRT